MSSRPSSKYLIQSDISLLIEQLVQAIERLDRPIHLREHRLNRYLDHIDQMLNLFDGAQDYDCSVHLQLFQEAVYCVGLERSPVGGVSYDKGADRYRDTSETLLVLVQRIWELTREPGYRRQQYDRRQQSREQERELREYVDGMFARYARVLVVRVNLYYRREAQNRLRVEHVFRDLDKLFSVRRSRGIFDHEIGYICRIEQGDDISGRGYHAHVAFFYQGARVRGDVHKAQQIGELWEHVTLGGGCFDSCNHGKDERYGDRLGIGMIHRDDLIKRENLYFAMNYLVKDVQYLRLRPRKGRSLRRGRPMRW